MGVSLRGYPFLLVGCFFLPLFFFTQKFGGLKPPSPPPLAYARVYILYNYIMIGCSKPGNWPRNPSLFNMFRGLTKVSSALMDEFWFFSFWFYVGWEFFSLFLMWWTLESPAVRHDEGVNLRWWTWWTWWTLESTAVRHDEGVNLRWWTWWTWWTL